MGMCGARRKLGDVTAGNFSNSYSARQVDPGALDDLINLNMQDDIMEYCCLFTDEAERYLVSD